MTPETSNQTALGGPTRALWILLPIIVAFSVHYMVFSGIPAPPSNHGSGSMFDLIATRYDIINRVLALGMDIGWRRRMVEIIQTALLDREHPRILDMATGTADVAIMLKQSIPKATVIGLDPSQQMLSVGRNKVSQNGWSDRDVSLQYADAQDFAHHWPISSFDAGTMAFGIRNVPNRSRALCEIHTVLVDGARFCIMEFSEPDDSFGVLGQLTRIFIRHVVPFVGGLLSGAPREYWHLQKSIKEFPPPKEFRDFLQGLQCPVHNDSETVLLGSFRVDEIIHLTFGSVQIYVTTVLKSGP